MNPTKDITADVIAGLDALIEAAPDAETSLIEPVAAPRSILARTGLPKRYRAEWERPQDAAWGDAFAKIMQRLADGGICALIGPRGTGKTRLAAEAIRNYAPESATYDTAMGLFLRVRASFGKKTGETERQIVDEMSTARLLVLDEIQERGESAWEDRILTHVLDRRYGGMIPTIVIANLTEDELIQSLGPSIISRLMETGGVIEVKGPSHRIQ